MANRFQGKSERKKDGWLNIYADMITLILVFFILLYSMSSLDQEKYRMLVQAFSTDPETIEKLKQIEKDGEMGGVDITTGTETGGGLGEIKNLDDLYQYLKTYVENNNLQGAVEVQKGDDMVSVRFMSTLFFEADRAVLKDGGKKILDFVGQALGEVEPRIEIIRIDGHTAEAAPGTSTVDDRGLSTDRANEVLKYMEDRYIKEPGKLIAVGYGMYRPIAPNDSEANRAKNRRVEILVSKEDSLQKEIEKLFKLNDGNEDNDTRDGNVKNDGNEDNE